MRRTLACIFVFAALGSGLMRLHAQRVQYPAGSLGEYEVFRSGVITFFDGYRSCLQNQTYNRPFTPELPNDSIRILEISQGDDDDFRYLRDDGVSIKSKKPVKWFYQYPSAFYAKKEKDYGFVVNPVIGFWGGKESASNRTLFQNSRGAEIWGNIGGTENGLGFYTYFTDNQMVMPSPYNTLPDSLNFVPNELFYKRFKKTGVDFFQARGYITFNAIKGHVKFKFGHDRNKIGYGYRSLILSDFAPQYLFFKINTDFGKIHYQNLFTQFTDNGPILSNVLFGKKYAAFHRLSVDVTRNLSIGINEMVIFDRMDSTQMNQFDPNYLNPVIFYRAVESNLGSRDNSLLALDFNWTVRNKFLFYGQFLLDEFKLSELKNNKNWWGNKYGYQLGARAFNLIGTKYRLDLLLEYNRVRPYTYSHSRTTQSYSHFNQPLAHPLGSNFDETVVEMKYKPSYRLFITGTLIMATQGKDSSLNGRNYGSNILRSYDTRVTSNNSRMFMGRYQALIISEVMVSYMFKHNLFIDLRYNYRMTGNQTASLSSNSFYGLGLRLNCNVRQFNY